MKTYQDYLLERGMEDVEKFICPDCLTPHPAFAIVEVTPGNWQCSQCYLTEYDAARRAAEEARLAALPPWETEEANTIRAVRVRLLDKWRWGVMPDSPLIDSAKDKVMVYLKALNSITIRYASPADVVWPDEPTIDGSDYEQST